MKQNLSKLREENSKEEDKLKRNKRDAEQFLADNTGLYDHLMEEATKEKADLLVNYSFNNFKIISINKRINCLKLTKS